MVKQVKINNGLYNKYIKRPMDFFISLVAIILLCPVFIIVFILVRINLGSPVIFKQDRPGLNEKVFKMYKFRTMTNVYDSDGQLLPDTQRLTKFGKFLRSTSLDELPEFFNIIKGEMSIVGPRPLLIQYLSLYNERQKKRHDVRPGLTGLAQVSGRNAISWNDKFELDIAYVENVGFLNDWKIIFRTISKVVLKEGINSNTAATVEPFRGSRNETIQ